MGVNGLWALLAPAARPVDMEQLQGKVLAVDLNLWLMQVIKGMRDGRGEAIPNAHLHGIWSRTCKLLYHNARPIFVMDGGAPAIKQQTLAARRQKAAEGETELKKATERMLLNHARQQLLHDLAQTPADSAATAAAQPAPSSAAPRRRRPAGPDMYDLPPLSAAAERRLARAAAGLDSSDEDSSPELQSSRLPGSVAASAASRRARRRAQGMNEEEEEEEQEQEEGMGDDEEALAADPTAAAAAPTSAAASSSAPPAAAAEGDDSSAPRTWNQRRRRRRARIEKYTLDLANLDIDSHDFAVLPPHIKYEILTEMLESEKTRSRRHNIEYNGADAFSMQQVLKLRKRSNVGEKLNQVREALLRVDSAEGIAMRKVVSEKNTVFILERLAPPALEDDDGADDDGADDDGADEDGEGDVDALSSQHETSLPPHSTAAGANVPGTSRKGSGNRAIDSAAVNADKERGGRASPGGAGGDGGDDAGDADDADDAGDDGDDDSLSFASISDLETADADKTGGTPTRSPRPDSASSIESRALQQAIALSLAKAPAAPPVPDPVILSSSESETEDKPTVYDAGAREAGIPMIRPSLRASAIADKSAQLGSAVRTHLTPTINARPDMLEIGEVSSDSSDAESEHGVDAATAAIATSPPPAAAAANARVAAPQPMPLRSIEDNNASDLDAALPSPVSSELHVESPAAQTATPTPAADVGAAVSPASPSGASAPAPPFTSPAPNVAPMNDEADAGEATRRESEEPEGEPEARAHEDPPEAAAAMDAAEQDFVKGVRMAELSSREGVEKAQLTMAEEEAELQRQIRRSAIAAAGVTPEMLAEVQLMLRLFGIPYLVAPMEAEAQCAQLELAGMTNGTITDDSDIFLFGARHVYRRMCSKHKEPEHYDARDIEDFIGMDRGKLIQMAYLLGSDYTAGLPGVGVVLGAEILSEFGGENALRELRRWLDTVDTGPMAAAPPRESKVRSTLRRLKKRHGLDNGFPDPRVEYAYRHPTVDDSEEPFEWALPDVAGLREFAERKLGWTQERTDSQLMPILQRMNQTQAASAQSRITNFFSRSRQYRPNRKEEDKGLYSGQKRLRRAVTKLVVAKNALSGELADEDVEAAADMLEEDLQEDAEDGGDGGPRKAGSKKKNNKRQTRGKKRKATAAAGGGKRAARSKAKTKAKGKRPLSAYMRWMQETRDELRSRYPETSAAELARHAGEHWRALSDAEKKPYVDAAAAAWTAHRAAEDVGDEDADGNADAAGSGSGNSD